MVPDPPQARDTVDPRLMELIKEHSWTKHLKVLLCAEDVRDALLAASAPGNQQMPWDPFATMERLMGIQVTVFPDSAPGTWRMIRHDGCEVDPERGIVRHRKCTIIGESEAS